MNVKYLMEESKNADISIQEKSLIYYRKWKILKNLVENIKDYYKNREHQLLKMRQYNNKSYEMIQEYQRKYYLRNRDALLLLRAEHYINIKQERNKNENNVVI